MDSLAPQSSCHCLEPPLPTRLDIQESIAVLTLDRAEALNALNAETVAAINAAFDRVAASDARALIVVGAGGKAFCAGADIKELMNADPRSRRTAIEFAQGTFAKLDRLHIPSIAVIQGYAFGGGLELAMACTFRIATPSALMGLPEIKLGLIPGYGGTQRLPRLVGEARATEIVLSGRTINAVEAERIGLVNLLVEDGDPVTLGQEYAKQFVRHSLSTLQLARSAIQRAMSSTLIDGLRTEADLICLALQTSDASEGMAAFVEKRPPQFRDH